MKLAIISISPLQDIYIYKGDIQTKVYIGFDCFMTQTHGNKKSKKKKKSLINIV